MFKLPQIASRKGVVLPLSFLLFVSLFAYFLSVFEAYRPTYLTVIGRGQVGAKIFVDWDPGSGAADFRRLSLTIPRTDFAEKLDLPAQQIKRLVLSAESAGNPLTLTSATISTDINSLSLLASEHDLASELVLDVASFSRRYHPLVLVLFQGILAAFVVYLLWLVYTELRAADPDGVLGCLYWRRDRLWFWIPFFSALILHSVWLLAYWPAAMTNDSWSTLSDAYNLRFGDWHPFVYTFYVLALLSFWNSVVVVAFFQIIVTCLLICYIFYYCLRQGLSWLLVAPFYILFLLSVPVGLMNVVLWKDVPFSLGILTFCFLVFALAHGRASSGKKGSLPVRYFPILALIFVAMFHMRHNGIILYPITLALLYYVVNFRNWLQLSSLILLVFVSCKLVFPALLGIHATKGSPYHEVRTALAIATHYTFFSEDREADFSAISNYLGMDWSEIKEKFPQNWFYINDHGAAQHQYKPDLGYTSEYNKNFLTRLILNNIPIFVAARTFDLLHSIAIDSSHSDNRNGFFENPSQLVGSNLHPPGNMVFGVALDSRPPWPWLRERVLAVDKWSREYYGLFSPQVLVWNLALPFVVFFLILFWEKGLSPISLFLLPGLVAALGVFILGAGESWRYFYYIYLQWMVVIPLYIAFKRRVPGVF